VTFRRLAAALLAVLAVLACWRVLRPAEVLALATDGYPASWWRSTGVPAG
jgi:hypothetical protein